MSVIGRVLPIVVFIIMMLVGPFQITSAESDDLGVVTLLGMSTINVDAVVGKRATLPCDIEPDTYEDRVYMVLWFRHTGGKPLYSFDVRGRGFGKALHWSDPATFGARANFLTLSKPAALIIYAVQLDDEGVYRCRVDFKNSPTRNFQIRLNVIVPPHQVLLYDDHGRDIAGVIGPLEEGGNFNLICEVRGGRPQPTLRWLFNNNQIDNHEVLRDDGKAIVSRIRMHNAERSWLNNTIRCQAINTNLLSPHERTARIEMNLPPTFVEILPKPTVVDADKTLVLECVVRGSRPQVEITWYRANLRYTKGRIEETENDTTKISRITMVPQPEDDGAIFRCRAENTLLSVAVEDSFKLTVEYKPVVHLTLGSTLNPEEIKEGDDVYLECHIKANPKEKKITWYHEPLKELFWLEDDGDGYHRDFVEYQVPDKNNPNMFISNKSLVMQKVTRLQGGLYRCKVTNSKGVTSSDQMILRVRYVPFCIEQSPVLIGARIDENLKVRCSVAADPQDVIFSWQFNNSGETIQVSPFRYAFLVTAGGTSSELRYTTSSERDYGALICRANNSIGLMKHPCVFQIVPAARPNPPTNCTVMKIARRSEPYLAVRCLIGFDGGLKQHFTLEITGEPTQVLVNTTGRYNQGRYVWLNTTWSAFEGILPNQNLVVVARNDKGPADPVVLNVEEFREPVKIETEKKEEPPYVVVAVLVVLAVLLAVGAAIAAFALKRRRASASTVTSKRPSQSVIQVDSQGRRCIIAYPTTSDKATKPDILNPRQDNPHQGRPRVVLASSGETYTLRDVVAGPCHVYPIPPRDEAVTPQR